MLTDENVWYSPVDMMSEEQTEIENDTNTNNKMMPGDLGALNQRLTIVENVRIQIIYCINSVLCWQSHKRTLQPWVKRSTKVLNDKIVGWSICLGFLWSQYCLLSKNQIIMFRWRICQVVAQFIYTDPHQRQEMRDDMKREVGILERKFEARFSTLEGKLENLGGKLDNNHSSILLELSKMEGRAGGPSPRPPPPPPPHGEE